MLSGVWLIVPDAHWVYPPQCAVTNPVIHDVVVANVFCLHGYIDASLLDRLDTFERQVALVVLTLVLVVAYATFQVNPYWE